MDFLTLCAQRYSVRSYLPDPVPEAALAEILRAGQLAPTAKNNQSQKILVLQSPEAKAKLRELHACYGAPLVLLVCGDEEIACNRPVTHHSMAEMDASIVATHMMLAAKSLGVDSTWICAFDHDKASELFALPEHVKPHLLLALGYPAADGTPSPRHTDRKPLEQTVTYL